MFRFNVTRAGALALVLNLPGPAAAGAASFPPVTEAELALSEVERHPGAPAVVLFEKAELKLMDLSSSEVSSHLRVQVRLKILKEEGRRYGEIEIPHSRFYRLTDFEGRTVKPDGTAVELEKDSIFEERTSRARKSFVTKAAFPAVEAGAILDYRYTLKWDNIFYLEPWYFHNEVPTLYSEVVFSKPDNMALQPWYKQTSAQEIRFETRRSHRGVELYAWMEDLPPVPEEPHSFPYEDLSARFMAVPTAVMMSGQRVPLLESWKELCQLFEQSFYGGARRKDRQAAKKAAALTAGAGSAREKAAQLYAFVRDEILTSSEGVFVSDEPAADKVLADHQGSSAEQALLLQAMLAAVKLKSKLVWAADRRAGRPDLSVPNPFWFDLALVAVEAGGETVYLDPTDRGLAFARLSPYVEGTQALVMDKKKPEVITLPQRPFDDNVRRAVVELALDEDGRVIGHGSLNVRGHHAWAQMWTGADAGARAEAWQAWLDGEFEGYETSDVEVEESIEEQHIRVTWSLAQREDEVLGDEASLQPSRPLGPVRQPFTLEAQQRFTPVFFAFGDRDEVELRVTWPEGWELDLLPGGIDYEHEVGALNTDVRFDEAERRLTFTRRVDIHAAEFVGRDKYAALRTLYDLVEKSDAQDIVLVAR